MKSYLTKTNLILITLLLLLIWFIGSVQAILLPFILAFILAYVLHPVVEKLSKKLNDTLSTSLVVFGFCVFVILLFLTIVPILQSQVLDFMRHIPQFATSVWNHIKGLMVITKENIPSEQLAELSESVRDSVINVLTAVGASLTQILMGGVAIFNLLALILITPVVLFYVLRDWKGITMHIKDLIPKDKEKGVLALLSDINQTLSGFIRGQALVCLCLAIFYAIGFSLTGLDFGILIGLLSGILSFIPYFGFGIGLILSVFLGFMQGFTWGQWGGLATVLLIGQILEGYILTPRLVGDRIGLHPVWVIFALLAGGAIAGFMGILLAVPVAAIIGVLIRYTLKWYHQTDFYQGKHHK